MVGFVGEITTRVELPIPSKSAGWRLLVEAEVIKREEERTEP